MKRLFIYTFLAVTVLLTMSCSEEKLDTQSHLYGNRNEVTDFDLWLEENYRAPYNIRVLYRYEDLQTNLSHDFIPADEIYSRILAKILRFVWIDVYSEVAGNGFMREHAPRVLQFLGPASYNEDGSQNIGFAEGGQKITLNAVNWMESKNYVEITYDNPYDDTDNPDDWTDGYGVELTDIAGIKNIYLHYTHHEFAHILHQKKQYPTEFEVISQHKYTSSWASQSELAARQGGFVSAYASSGASEDFVETFATYVSLSEAEWEKVIADSKLGGAGGYKHIESKIEIVKAYFKSSWDLDLDEMRSVMMRRFSELEYIDWSDFEIEK